jgi:hypothetical protein
MKCPTATGAECSGRGVCTSMKRMATLTYALPLSPATTYTGADASTTWDENKVCGAEATARVLFIRFYRHMAVCATLRGQWA